MKIYGPYQIDIKVMLTDGDQEATVTYGLRAGPALDATRMDEILASVESDVKKQLGDDWHLCTKEEFFNALMSEETGTDMKFAMPGGEDWDSWEDQLAYSREPEQ